MSMPGDNETHYLGFVEWIGYNEYKHIDGSTWYLNRKPGKIYTTHELLKSYQHEKDQRQNKNITRQF